MAEVEPKRRSPSPTLATKCQVRTSCFANQGSGRCRRQSAARGAGILCAKSGSLEGIEDALDQDAFWAACAHVPETRSHSSRRRDFQVFIDVQARHTCCCCPSRATSVS